MRQLLREITREGFDVSTLTKTVDSAVPTDARGLLGADPTTGELLLRSGRETVPQDFSITRKLGLDKTESPQGLPKTGVGGTKLSKGIEESLGQPKGDLLSQAEAIKDELIIWSRASIAFCVSPSLSMVVHSSSPMA